MKRLSLPLIALIIGLPATSNAASIDTISIVGAMTCGQWAEGRAKRNAIPGQFWLLGYLSGLANQTQVDFLKNIDPDSLDLWMDNYCRNNPLNSIQGGAHALAIELIKRRRQ